MAKQTTEFRRKLVGFDEETWHALNLPESMRTFQELADEAFRDLLQKHGRPTDLKAALRECARPSAMPGQRRHAAHHRRGVCLHDQHGQKERAAEPLAAGLANWSSLKPMC
jgi:hypothetical protein